MRRVIATLVAPLATGVACFLAFAILNLLKFEPISVSGLMGMALEMAFWTGVATVIAYAMTLLAGLPLAMLLERRGRGDLRHIVWLGAILGALPFGLFDVYVVVADLSLHPTLATLPRLSGDLPWALLFVALGAACGAASASSYWFIMHRR